MFLNALRSKLLFVVLALFLQSCVAVTATNNEAKFPTFYEMAKSVPAGASAAQIREIMGQPQRVFNESNSDRSAFYYCLYGLTKSASWVFWVSEEVGYYDARGDVNGRKAIWFDESNNAYNCHSRANISWAYAPKPPKHPFGWEIEEFNIDLLRVTVMKQENVDSCHSGGISKLVLEGQISPDSSFAMSRLLDRLKPCADLNGRILTPITVSLRSGGGFLSDGYLMGETFRERGVTTVIDDQEVCASSCAVAFLGAVDRVVEDKGQIMFHAPYFSGKNEYGQRDIDCDVGEESLNKLKDYYISMTDKETGERLFERTMWYCSADDGWVVTGGAAAELYGIATER